MKTLLEDWIDACEGRANLDKSHFLALFKEHRTKNELEKIFSYFPNSAEMINRVNEVLTSGNLEGSMYLLPTPTDNQDLLIKMGTLWLNEQCLFFRLKNNFEFYSICRHAKVDIINRTEQKKYYNCDIPTYWIFDFISDEIRKSITYKQKTIYLLKEALYGIAADYYLSFYILQPLINLEIDFTHYFNFWKVGGVGFITESEYLISTIDLD